MSEADPSVLALGVDIGATFIKAAVVNTGGELIKQFRAASPRSADTLRAFVQSAAQQADTPLKILPDPETLNQAGYDCAF